MKTKAGTKIDILSKQHYADCIGSSVNLGLWDAALYKFSYADMTLWSHISKSPLAIQNICRIRHYARMSLTIFLANSLLRFTSCQYCRVKHAETLRVQRSLARAIINTSKHGHIIYMLKSLATLSAQDFSDRGSYLKNPLNSGQSQHSKLVFIPPPTSDIQNGHLIVFLRSYLTLALFFVHELFSRLTF